MKIDWNRGWTFSKEGGQATKVTLPHDAMLGEKRDGSCRNGVNSGYFPGGKYIYEKKFEISAEDVGKSMVLHFEGVYQNCAVTVNGTIVGSHKYGYTAFDVDISKAVHAGINKIRVDVDNSLEPNCRWYSGSGIYRPVTLLVDELEKPRIVTKSISPAVIEIMAEENSVVKIYDGEELVVTGTPGKLTIPGSGFWSGTLRKVCG